MSNTAETVWLVGISDFQLLKNLHWTPYAEFWKPLPVTASTASTIWATPRELLTTLPSTVFVEDDARRCTAP